MSLRKSKLLLFSFYSLTFLLLTRFFLLYSIIIIFINFNSLLSLLGSVLLGIFFLFLPFSKKQLIIFTLINTMNTFLLTLNITLHFNVSKSNFQFLYKPFLNYIVQTYYLSENFFTNVTFSVFELILGVDGFSLSLILLTTFLIPICLLSNFYTVKITNLRFFLFSFLLLELSLIFAFTVLNLLLFYIFFESVLIPMLFIIGIWGARHRKIHAIFFFFFLC